MKFHCNSWELEINPAPSNTRSFRATHNAKFSLSSADKQTDIEYEYATSTHCMYIPARGNVGLKVAGSSHKNTTREEKPASGQLEKLFSWPLILFRSDAQTRAGFPRVHKTDPCDHDWWPRGVSTEKYTETRKEFPRRFETAGVAIRDRLADCRPPDVATRPLPMTHATLVRLKAWLVLSQPPPLGLGHRTENLLTSSGRRVYRLTLAFVARLLGCSPPKIPIRVIREILPLSNFSQLERTKSRGDRTSTISGSFHFLDSTRVSSFVTLEMPLQESLFTLATKFYLLISTYVNITDRYGFFGLQLNFCVKSICFRYANLLITFLHVILSQFSR